MIRLAIAGAKGRTGRRVAELADQDVRFIVEHVHLHAQTRSDGSVHEGGRLAAESLERVTPIMDVLVDFTSPEGTRLCLQLCEQMRAPLVIGTTGHDEPALQRIRDASREIPILQAANFSVGINLILGLLGQLARELGEAYDVEIVEAHHRNKVDAPSGTALALAEEICRTTGRSMRDDAVFGRHGRTGERRCGEIGVHAVRMGDVVGRHEIHFSGPGETITLLHEAHSRDAFAAGALRAAAWIVGKPPGLYSFRDVFADR